MENKSKIELGIRLFDSVYEYDRSFGSFVINEEYVKKTIEKIAVMEEFDENERLQIKRDIEHRYQIKQEKGTVILGDYEHEEWYKKIKDSLLHEHWYAYKNYLRVKSNFSPNVLDNLDLTLDDLTECLGNPNSETMFSRRGLVIGDVQSGKTSNYIGLMCKAADAGYKVIILLTGTIESLRRQTQIRVEEGFIGYDVISQKRVGVGEKKALNVHSFTSRESDFTGKSGEDTGLSFSDQKTKVLVIKKNVSTLKKLYKAMKGLNTLSSYDYIDAPLLIIDDESDNASINTNKPDSNPTVINQNIRNFMKLFSRSCYIGYTATPYANIFIDPLSIDEMYGNDLFPEDFIYALNAPSNYFGAHNIFVEDSPYLVNIRDEDDKLFSHSHKKDWNGELLFNSFYDSIKTFYIANAIRDLRGEFNTHRTMLINISRFISVQNRITTLVKNYTEELNIAIRQNILKDFYIAIKNPFIKELHDQWEKHYRHLEFSWQQIANILFESVKDIEITCVNSLEKNKLDYEKYKKTGLRTIVIGGLALSRGLTLEGLIISYFYRNTSTYDVLMQMGRWFGYREKYKDLFKIWITEYTANWYSDISEATQELKNDMVTMRQLGKTPKQFGVRVRNDNNDLGITSPNKMRNTVEKVRYESFFGNFYETAYLHKYHNEIESNYELVRDFIRNRTNRMENSNNPVFKDQSSSEIVSFIEKFSIPNQNVRFDKVQIIDFILDQCNELRWDVALVQGDRKNGNTEISGVIFHPIDRKIDIRNDVIRVSKSRARLGGPSDTRLGLSETDINDIRNNIESSNNAQKYLIEKRNPLLLIYLIDATLSNENSDDYETQKLYLHLKGRSELLVGISVAFPSRNDVKGDIKKYRVNDNYDYFKYAHDYEDETESENEEVNNG